MCVGFLSQLSETVLFCGICKHSGPELSGTGANRINTGGHAGTMLVPWLSGILFDTYDPYLSMFLMFVLAATVRAVITPI